MAPKVQIVLARKEEDVRIVQYGRTDLGEAHKFETIAKPVACLWLKAGREADVEKARAYAKAEGYTVFTYPTNVRDSLEQAKVAILAV